MDRHGQMIANSILPLPLAQFVDNSGLPLIALSLHILVENIENQGAYADM